MDLQIRTTRESWLLLAHETFPTGVNDVAELRDGTWLFSGNDIVHARWLARASDVIFKDVEVASSSGQSPVILGKIEIENMSPQRWVEQGGHGDHRTTYGGKLVHSGIEAICATWFDLRGRVDDNGP